MVNNMNKLFLKYFPILIFECLGLNELCGYQNGDPYTSLLKLSTIIHFTTDKTILLEYIMNPTFLLCHREAPYTIIGISVISRSASSSIFPFDGLQYL
jgi:hypothetical protein